jgi:putative HTH-type transcriptional regulator (araC family)
MTPTKYSHSIPAQNLAVGTTDLTRNVGNRIDITGCIVLLVQSGCAVINVNSRRWALRQGDVLILFYDDMMVVNERSTLFSAQFVTLDYKHIEDTVCKMTASDFWYIHYYECPVYHASQEEQQLLSSWWRQMEWFDNRENSVQRDSLLASGFYVFLSAAEATITELPSKPLPDTRSRKLVVDFYKLLAQHCKRHRDVAFYANELCITTTYLYKVCLKVLGFSPKEEIDQLTIFEIKSYLTNTDMPIKQIASELNFEDVSYLCRYFKRLTGMSPADYRKGQARL